MDEKHCSDCVHYGWIEDYYDDGSYVNEEFCGDNIHDDCSYYRPACEHFCEID